MSAEFNIQTIITIYTKPLYSFCVRLIGNPDDAQDVVQDIFIKLWKHRDSFDSSREASLKTWIFTIARNSCYDYLRKKKQTPFSAMNFLFKQQSDDETGADFEDVLVDELPQADELFIEKENREQVEKALAHLSSTYREVIILHYTEGMTFEEISKVVGKPLNTVKSQHRRALAIMKTVLVGNYKNNTGDAPE